MEGEIRGQEGMKKKKKAFFGCGGTCLKPSMWEAEAGKFGIEINKYRLPHVVVVHV